MDKGRFLRVPEQLNDGTMDKYTAAIELSNACRQFYQARVEAANCIKSRWQMHAGSTRFNDNERRSNENGNVCKTTNTPRRHRNSIDEAMEKLRTEMTSLMDQDLSLMRQLLTLNETIEDLKWQRRYYYSRSSLRGSSADLAASGSSLSDMTDSEEEEEVVEGRLGQGELRLSEHHHHHHPHRSQTCRHDHPLLHHKRTHNCAMSSVPAVSIAPAPTCPVPCVVLCPPHSPSNSSSSFSSSTKSTTSFSTASSSSSSKLKRGPVVTSPCHLASATARADGKSTWGSEKAYHSEQDSLDSGIHETFSSSSGEEEAVV